MLLSVSWDINCIMLLLVYLCSANICMLCLCSYTDYFPDNERVDLVRDGNGDIPAEDRLPILVPVRRNSPRPPSPLSGGHFSPSPSPPPRGESALVGAPSPRKRRQRRRNRVKGGVEERDDGGTVDKDDGAQGAC
jgi:hypothetical protein